MNNYLPWCLCVLFGFLALKNLPTEAEKSDMITILQKAIDKEEHLENEKKELKALTKEFVDLAYGFDELTSALLVENKAYKTQREKFDKKLSDYLSKVSADDDNVTSLHYPALK